MANYWFIQGLTHLRYEGQDNLKKAQQSFEAALKYDDQFAEAYARLARTHIKLANLENANASETPITQQLRNENDFILLDQT